MGGDGRSSAAGLPAEVSFSKQGSSIDFLFPGFDVVCSTLGPHNAKQRWNVVLDPSRAFQGWGAALKFTHLFVVASSDQPTAPAKPGTASTRASAKSAGLPGV